MAALRGYLQTSWYGLLTVWVNLPIVTVALIVAPAESVAPRHVATPFVASFALLIETFFVSEVVHWACVG